MKSVSLVSLRGAGSGLCRRTFGESQTLNGWRNLRPLGECDSADNCSCGCACVPARGPVHWGGMAFAIGLIIPTTNSVLRTPLRSRRSPFGTTWDGYANGRLLLA